MSRIRRAFPQPIMALVATIVCLAAEEARGQDSHAMPASSQMVSLDGEGWLLATDPKNIGRDEQWWNEPRSDAKPTKVPWIIQEPFPGYHGVAWYWRDFAAGVEPVSQRSHFAALLGRRLYGRSLAERRAGRQPRGRRVAVRAGRVGRDPRRRAQPTGRARVLNPTHEPIDGIVLAETPHRNKALPYSAGSAWDQGGIIDSVELLTVPSVYLEDVFVRPDWKTGRVRIQTSVRNATRDAVPTQLEVSVAPAKSGETLATRSVQQSIPAGTSQIDTELQVDQPRLWELSDPFLYRVTVRVRAADSAAFDEQSVRCGFRDFRVENGAFRLNGRRIYLRCSHTGNCCPIGLELPPDPDFLRRDLLNAKVMGFNAIRFISGVAKRYQLDLCDEIGLMVYEEAYASWCLADSPKMAQRYDESILGMVRRDRNHASVTIWGLLNETPDGPVFRHAVSVLPALRQLDDSRLVMLNSGRWDVHSGRIAGIEVWRNRGTHRSLRHLQQHETNDPSAGHHLVAGATRLSSRPQRRICGRALDGAGGGQGGFLGRLYHDRRASHDGRPRAAQRPIAIRRGDQRPRRRPGAEVPPRDRRPRGRHDRLRVRFRQRQLRSRHDRLGDRDQDRSGQNARRGSGFLQAAEPERRLDATDSFGRDQLPTRPVSRGFRSARWRPAKAASAIRVPRFGKMSWPTSIRTSASRTRRTSSARCGRSTAADCHCSSRNTGSAARWTCGARRGITSGSARRTPRTRSSTATSWTASSSTGSAGAWPTHSDDPRISSPRATLGWPASDCWG